MEDGHLPNDGPAYVQAADVASIVRAVMEGLGNPHRQQPRAEPTEQDRAGLLNSFKKLNPPMFSGDSNPQVAESWYKQIERLLGSMKVQTDQDKIALATIQFEGEANHW